MSHAAKTKLSELWKNQLVREYDHINWAYKLSLARAQIRLVTASSYWGQWDPLTREIKISSKLIEQHPWIVVIEVLKHEIAHQLVTDRLGIDDGHGPQFKSFCDLLGIDKNFQKSKSQIDFATLAIGKSSEMNPHSSDPEAVKLLAKAERLLALAQSQNQHEAMAAMEKVNELYEKYNIERFENKRASADHSFLLIELGSRKVHAIHSLICSILSEHFFVETILSQTYVPHLNQSQKTIEIFGTEANLKIAEYVFHFLTNQAEELWRAEKDNRRFSGKSKRSYQLGLLHGFNHQLTDSKKRRNDARSGTVSPRALANLGKDSNLMEFIKNRHPRVRLKQWRSGRVHSEAFNKGHEEGQALRLNKGIENTTKGLSGLLTR